MFEDFNHRLVNENKIITDYFNGIAFCFLCIGSSDGNDHLFPLLSQGWQGIYCEPAPMECSELIVKTAPFKDQVTIINSAILHTSGLAPMYICTNGIGTSSLHKSHADSNRQVVPNPDIRKIVVNTLKSEDLISFIGNNLALISIDAEGSDSDIIRSLPWKELNQCRMVFVETLTPKAEKVLRKNNFVLHVESTVNSNKIYVRDLQ
jgi:FkbM family methyltransferase